MSFMMFLIVVHLIILKIAGATLTFSTLTANVINCAVNNCLVTRSDSSSSFKNLDITDQSVGEFVPPNYSGPDSTRGSGTR
jgi:hypothetical protein